MFISLLVSSLLQLILFSAIPFTWWFFFWRKKEAFLKWIGFKTFSIHNKSRFIVYCLAILIFLLVPGLVIIPNFVEPDVLATNQFYGLGVKALLPAFIYAFIQTGLSEEIFFRGFLAKRFMNKFGFTIGNVIQALLFGLIHGVLLLSMSSVMAIIAVILFTSIAGFLMGWINEKESNGSILTSWILHGTVNVIASIYMMFDL